MTVTTRFAPSPTGMLHIGGARTALFNLLFARRHGGKFLLRVEDTDIKRSTPEAVEAILAGLEWLGVTSDEPPVFQRAQAKRHADCAEIMLASGAAFRCYVTPEELEARRDEGEAKRAAAKADGLSDAERVALRAEADALLAPFRSPYRDGGAAPARDAPFTVRLRAPDKGSIIVDDQVQGRIEIRADEIDDLILLRADGTPTYMLAVVVDDHDMGVTHVIRGDDHLRNTFRQLPIYQGLGWIPPVFAHVPMIHGPDGAKLSKRHGALGVEAYREMGYLPEALANYLLRLGWSHGDWELFTLEEAAAVFDLAAIGRAPARIDFDKLASVNAHYIRNADDDALAILVLDRLKRDRDLSPEAAARVRVALPHMKDRGPTLPDLAAAFGFLIAERPLELNKRARKSLKGEGLDRLAMLRQHIEKTERWTQAELETALQAFCDKMGVTMGEIGPPVRAALTGGAPAPDLGQVFAWLGRDEALGRIDDQLGAGGAAATQEGS